MGGNLSERPARPSGSAGIRAVLFHLFCVAALFWPALINGQPFFFSDTTSYIRAADMAVYLASDHSVSTAWTSRYAGGLDRGPDGDIDARAKAAAPGVPGANDVGSGNVMAGRSPYFGAALYLGYVSSDFWLFVLGYAAVTYLLLALSLRAFGVPGRKPLLGAVLFLSALTTVAFYNSYLLADALTAQGIVAFLLLAANGDRYRRGLVLLLAAIMAFSAMAHLTHILILLAMTLCGLLLVRMNLISRAAGRWACGAGALAVLLGLVSTMATSLVVEKVMGKPPILVPLLTARFIEDGPGARYMREHCGERHFTVCRFQDQLPIASQPFLWSIPPKKGVYMGADAKTRRALSAEDTSFAWEVWKHYPVEQTKMMLWNAVRQAVSFDSFWLNIRCGSFPCWALPKAERDTLLDTLSGRRAWPVKEITLVNYAVVILSVLALAAMAVAAARDRRTPREEELARLALAWTILILLALAVNAFLGGALSEPQSRYQGRVIWLLPFAAYLFGAAWLVARRPRLAA